MALLKWKHDKTKTVVREAVQSELRKLGHDSKVKWADYRFTASVGFGQILSVVGEISEKAIVLEKCDGLAGGTVLQEFRSIMEQLFPGGEDL